MKTLVMLAVMLAAAGLSVLAAPQQGQSNRPTARPAPSPTPEVTLLVATFRDDPNDMIQSDGLGPYYGSSKSGPSFLAAEIDADGYLNF